MDPLHPQPGSSLDPRNAVGRANSLETARAQMRAGNNLSLTDPRRMGKTVLLDMLCDAPGDGLLALKLDFEGVSSSAEFLTRAATGLNQHRSLPKQATAKLRSWFDGLEVSVPSVVKVRAGVSTMVPTDLLMQMIESVDEHLPSDRLLVVTMDEVPIAINNIADAEDAAAANQMLQTLRSLRRRDSRLRWIVCGSIGFHHVLRRCGTTEGAINDLVNLPLGPLAPEEAEELVRRLMLGIERAADDEAVAAMLHHSGNIPFLVHHLANRLHAAGTGPVTAEVVATAFQDFLDDRDGSRAATHLLSRLEPLYRERTTAAEAILDRVATDGPVDHALLEAPNDLLDDLIDDHYLIERAGTVRWRYDVLRRIWCHRRRLG